MWPGHSSPFKGDTPYFTPDQNDILIMEGIHYSTRRSLHGHLCDPAKGATWCKGGAAQSGASALVEESSLEKVTPPKGINNRLNYAVQILPSKNPGGIRGSEINGATLEYNFQITTPGQYSLYVGGNAFDGGSDSLYARIIGENDQTMSGPHHVDFYLVPIPHNTWSYTGQGMPETTSIYGPPREDMKWWLRAGYFKVRIYGRELGAAVHVVALVPSSFNPQNQQTRVESTRVHPCVLNSNLNGCMYDYFATPWVSSGCSNKCGQGNERFSRLVSCTREDGYPVSSTFCTNFGLVAPPSSYNGLSCTDYTLCTYRWIVGGWNAWSQCNVPCGRGLQERRRSVVCRRSDGSSASDSDCTKNGAGSKPKDFETRTCTGKNCSRPPPPGKPGGGGPKPPSPPPRSQVSRCFMVRSSSQCNRSYDSKGDCNWCTNRWFGGYCANRC